MAINVKKADNESGQAISEAYYSATEIILSSKFRIVNLLANAKPKTVDVTSTVIKFKCAKGQLSYIVPLKFLSAEQKKTVLTLVKNQVKPKKA